MTGASPRRRCVCVLPVPVSDSAPVYPYYAGCGCSEKTRHIVRTRQVEDVLRLLELTPATDVSDLGQLRRMFADVEARFGRLDVLVGNAAVLGMLSPVVVVMREACTLAR